ncbi:hypothetical protein BGZ76_008922 [Entomortierella beljakovae]|nr:hypothetical protein BGZ76_008922 [Entomortierella beljakovae]
MNDSIQEKIVRYEKFVNEGLRKDLKDALDARDAIYDQISDYLKLAKDIEVIKDNGLTEMKTQVDLGSNFYVQAKMKAERYTEKAAQIRAHIKIVLEAMAEVMKLGNNTSHPRKLGF